MESEYDLKFEEMKKYIPFLESMIKRLESTSTSSANPRQAQLDKIRSLRDLLLDKKKRMKMENLLKCEQVLVNLYAKVEQKDTMPGLKKGLSNLDTARNKLKSVVCAVKVKKEPEDTLPEIARASETEVVCVPGSKEPALFQRRPNKASISPEKANSKSPQKSVPKRQYTRVLVSPEPSARRWSTAEDPPSNKPLFSRRSPRKSPKRNSPSHKKEKKKSSKFKSKTKDLNITLNVPEESLNSLNTGDILSRIIKCSDNDVDIATLRDLRTQILSELKQTGASDDISDLILKSYKNKKKKSVKKKDEIEEGELSDSESEAIQSIYGSLVVVDNDKNKSERTEKTNLNTEKEPRKIQISLVINSDKDDQEQSHLASTSTDQPDFEMFDDVAIQTTSKNRNRCPDDTAGKSLGQSMKTNSSVSEKSDDFITIDVDEEDLKKNDSKIESRDSDSSYIDISSSDNESESPKKDKYANDDHSKNENSINDKNVANKDTAVTDNSANKDILVSKENNSANSKIPKDISIPNDQNVEKDKTESVNQANFYKPIKDNVDKTNLNRKVYVCIPDKTSENTKKITSKELEKESQSVISNKATVSEESKNNTSENVTEKIASSIAETQSQSKDQEKVNIQEPETRDINNDPVEIPLLNTEPVVPEPTKNETVSEIDILQALKNEILSETIAIPGTETTTPPLHQPKVTKVASAQEIVKKRISIEKYKEKSVSQQQKPTSLFIKKPSIKSKTSLKLTEEEQQRFNFLPLALEDSSDDESQEKTEYTVEDIYGDLAPKSPENEEQHTAGAAPIIIPVDPVKPTAASSKADIDMRTLMPLTSPNAPKVAPLSTSNIQPSLRNTVPELGNKVMEPTRPPLLDPRMRRDLANTAIKNSPNQHGLNPDRTPRQNTHFPNVTPSMTPNSRSFEMTPSHQLNLDDDSLQRKHVYAPMPTFESRDNREIVNNDLQEPHWELNSESSSDKRWSRWDSDLRDGKPNRKYDERDQRNRYSQQESVDYQKSRRESDNYSRDQIRKDRYEQRDDYCPRTPVHSLGRDCPATPTPSFGRIESSSSAYSRADCPTTPIHPFGRSDVPTTPSHPFGRTDCPATPIHPFGRSEHPMTPNHPFGRSDVPTTPSHPFGRLDAPMTPNHPFGRSDAPMTPSHPFGRPDTTMPPSQHFGRSEMASMTPNHPFGRNDYHGSKIKDPRLNRSHDYESRRNEDNRDQSYNKDRRFDTSQNSYQYSDSYRNHREQSNSSKYERGKQQYRERTPGRESSTGPTFSKDNENDRLYTRDRGQSNDYRRDLDANSKYRYRSQSVSRSDERSQQDSIGSSSGGNIDRKQAFNTMSVKRQSGRSFTIDTSVNTTFQEFLNGKGLQVFDYSFEDRKRRATSVGRSLRRIDTSESNVRRNSREGSVGRSLTRTNVHHEDTSGYKRMVNFVRAKSMGREVTGSADKSLKEIKADFKSYQDSYNAKEKYAGVRSHDKQIICDTRSRKDQFDKMRDVDKKSSPQRKTSYSPRKNFRDPRMNRDNYDKNKRYEDKKKNYGIVYSSDNIARGTILGSGYGVKNYKIPKIKRSVEEKEHKVEQKKDEKKVEGVNKLQTQNPKQKDIKVAKTNAIPEKAKSKLKKEKDGKPMDKKKAKSVNEKEIALKSKDNSEAITKRSTRTNKLNDKSSEEEFAVKIRKTKKAVIDSDSDTETVSQSQTVCNDSNKVQELNPKDGRGLADSESIEHHEENIFDSSFEMDDVFSDSIATDPVLSNLNDLIAHLDKDSHEDVVQDFDSLLENIDSPDGEIETLEYVSEVIKQDGMSINDGDQNKSQENNQSTKTIEVFAEDAPKNPSINIQETSLKDSVTITKDNEISKNENQLKDNKHSTIDENLDKKEEKGAHKEEASKTEETVQSSKSENIVSTTEIEIKETPLIDEKDCTRELLEPSEDRSSTPDSTIHINEPQKINDENVPGLPDSTAHKNGTNSVVTSTDQLDTQTAVIHCQKEKASESIGNLLSILQDKSKIKELLSMLGDTSGENEKIKKKLEKLSEIVSDDEDDRSLTNTLSEKIEEPEAKIDEPEAEKNAGKELEQQNANNEEPLLPNSEDDTTEMNKQGQDSNSSETNNVKKIKPRKVPVKKKKGKPGPPKSKRLTRSAANLRLEKAKKPSRELRQLRESLKEMFMKDEEDILNATGIRMCRLAKMVDEKNSNQSEAVAQALEPKPVVVLEKVKDIEKGVKDDKPKKKPGVKPRAKPPIDEKPDLNNDKSSDTKSNNGPKYKPGPKSKKRVVEEGLDPYTFEDSVSEATTNPISEHENESASENESLTSSKSFGSSEILAEVKKKPKRKRRYKWNSGIISSNKKRKKVDAKQAEVPFEELPPVQKQVTIPDENCFTDKTYCFLKSVHVYNCRLCDYSGNRIVKHYKTEHPHSEIPLSRMHPVLAREAIEQCEDINFQTISKMPTEKYVCRFCYEEFCRKQTNLEEFFWHVVSTHTGEYKQLCSECVNVTRCPYNLDIPPPPKHLQGQLIGYICGKCYFTQISLENLKMHVIVRHNDEQTAVYTINLAVMSKKTMNALMKRAAHSEESRVLRSSRSNPSITEISDPSDFAEGLDTDSIEESLNQTQTQPLKLSVQSKLTFEPDESISDANSIEVKQEKEGDEPDIQDDNISVPQDSDQISTDIVDYPHFKVYFGVTGIKEFICCINGKDSHYKTPLLISMKRHIQTKHTEVWDGYCFVCKVIVMPQGKYSFKDCLQHMVDNHTDNFPVLDHHETETNYTIQSNSDIATDENISNPTTPSKPIISIRPLSDLITTEAVSEGDSEAFPKIESVVSLGTTVEMPKLSPSLFKSPVTIEKSAPKAEEPYKYEEMQAEVMSKKHLVILDAMLSEQKLVQIYKCAGRFCSFTTDSADAAVLHASTHQRIGGENGLVCAYCDFDCKENSIDLVMHVFKIHGRCRFSCGQCFYRAVASQLVLAHMLRVHGSAAKKILETATVTPLGDDSEDILPRDIAVQHYVCADLETSCKYKTYTPGKFIEHLLKHKVPYMCSICLNASNSSTELLEHLKTHGLKLYQCTWCLNGSDNEAEFLEHSSSRHPTRQPQAYLRVITNSTKDGTSKTMVLPLVKLNKSSVSTQLVSSSCTAQDPVREAERALDLEKIITSMSLFSAKEATGGGASSTSTGEMSEPSPSLTVESSNSITKETEVTLLAQPPRMETPPALESAMDQIKQNPALQLTPILKQEPVDTTPQKNIESSSIICLDSDEEDSVDPPQDMEETIEKENVIDLSHEDPTLTETTNKKIKKSLLYKCGECTSIYKTLAGFKRHLKACVPIGKLYKCAHCSFEADQLQIICNHYNDHQTTLNQGNSTYICDVCGHTDKLMHIIKLHLKKDHGITNFNVSAKEVKDGTNYTLSDASKSKQPAKRKLSGGPISENLPKRIRYGVNDLHKIPQKPILDDLAYCSECEYSNKVRGNLIRHIQQHAENQLVPETAPVNPVPHLETNEKHFDKMINLASSSLELTRSEKSTPSVTLHIPPEAASRYPKYVPDRQRHTCGAKGCSYISVDEAMLKCHWETLHSGSTDFHCVHCPPYQYLDTSKPLTSARIIAHLKMHDIRLYACSSCTYYHYRKQVVEKHVAERHKNAAQVMIVREESTLQTPVTSQPSTSAAPTMDLKPWKCGLCAYKSMLRPEVVEHCATKHNSKMQFKCPVCPFRTSTMENVKKHQALCHPENTEDIFYYYYREGSIPDEADGTPRWVKQRQKCGNPDPAPEVKTETPETSTVETTTSQSTLQSILLSPPMSLQTLLNRTQPVVNLDIVKKEVPDPNVEETMEQLCALYGEICDPNGLKYKCPLCNIVSEDSKDAMQSHLFEELQYRRWGCSICFYKAFHKTGLNEHMMTEHRQSVGRGLEPKELPVDNKVERWVNKVLDHQTLVIEKNKANLAKQKIQGERPSAVQTTKSVEKISISTTVTEKLTDADLENLKLFGQFGAPNGFNFCCPKCEFQHPDENVISDHLESELNKIRWRCSACFLNAQNYHEAQLHVKTCKKSLLGQTARVIEAIRDPKVRVSWLSAVIRTQKEAMKEKPETVAEEIIKSHLENSLLVVRYEEKVPTPEEEMINRKKKAAPVASAIETSPDSDDERLIIDEVSTDDSETPKKKEAIRKCPYCPWSSKYQQQLDFHILRHYNLRPYTCAYCDLTFYSVRPHIQAAHPGMPERVLKTPIPSGPPLIYDLGTTRGRKRSSATSEESLRKEKTAKQKDDTKKEDTSKQICLTCEKAFLEIETLNHKHGNEKQTYFAKKGDVVVKCCLCLCLFPNIEIMQEHNSQSHPNTPINYAFFKLHHDKREIHQCGHCNKRFKFFRDLKVHHNTLHSSLQLRYESKPYCPGMYDVDCENEDRGENSKKVTDDVVFLPEEKAPTKRVAKKSTTKLPYQAVAKKSTTKLPLFTTEESESEDEYSYYGTKPTSLDELGNVTTMMTFCNTMMPFTVKKLSEIIKLDPRIVVKDCEK